MSIVGYFNPANKPRGKQEWTAQMSSLPGGMWSKGDGSGVGQIWAITILLSGFRKKKKKHGS